jgi:hypothetical protein
MRFSSEASMKFGRNSTTEKSVSEFGLDHGVGHSLLLLYDAKAPLGKKNNEFNSL